MMNYNTKEQTSFDYNVIQTQYRIVIKSAKFNTYVRYAVRTQRKLYMYVQFVIFSCDTYTKLDITETRHLGMLYC